MADDREAKFLDALYFGADRRPGRSSEGIQTASAAINVRAAHSANWQEAPSTSPV